MSVYSLKPMEKIVWNVVSIYWVAVEKLKLSYHYMGI